MRIGKINNDDTNINTEVIFTYQVNGVYSGLSSNNGFERHNYILLSNNQHQMKDLGCHYFLNLDQYKEQLISGDILKLDSKRTLFLSFRKSSKDNTLFLTNSCNNRCLMCSQPPSSKNDLAYYFQFTKSLIDILPLDINELGITGGEPTLHGENLIKIFELLYERYPDIYIHTLSNGRYFAKMENTFKFKDVLSKNMTIGIPLHSDYYADHDLISGKSGSHNETMKGLYNLASFKTRIELRIVINKINYQRLPQISEFIFKNLPFVNHVAFMGMENIGYAVKNKEQIWVDPVEYKILLAGAVSNLSGWNMNVSVYNIPYCLSEPSIYDYLCKSISEWKIKFPDYCLGCHFIQNCCGLFSTSVFQSSGIHPITSPHNL